MKLKIIDSSNYRSKVLYRLNNQIKLVGIISLFGFVACKNKADKNIVDEKTKKVHIYSVYRNSKEAGGDYNEYHNCNFDNFIADKRTPKLAKDIYLDNEWNLNNGIEILALLDSLSAKNKTSRPFYFKVLTKAYKKSDGYFAEGLGLAGKEYLENNTKN